MQPRYQIILKERLSWNITCTERWKGIYIGFLNFLTLKLLSRHSFVGTMVQVSAGARRGGMIGSNVRFQLSCLWQQEHPAASMSAAMSAWLKCANHTKPRIYPRARNSDGKPPSPPLVSRRPVQTNSKPKKKKKIKHHQSITIFFSWSQVIHTGIWGWRFEKGFQVSSSTEYLRSGFITAYHAAPGPPQMDWDVQTRVLYGKNSKDWKASTWNTTESSSIVTRPKRAGLMTYVSGVFTQRWCNIWCEAADRKGFLFFEREIECERRRDVRETALKQNAVRNLCGSSGLGSVESLGSVERRKLHKSFHNEKKIGELCRWCVYFFGPSLLVRCSMEAGKKSVRTPLSNFIQVQTNWYLETTVRGFHWAMIAYLLHENQLP